MPACPCCPSRAVPGVGLRLAQCPSASRSDRRAKEGEPAGRAAGPLEVTALPGSLRCLAASSSAGQGQPYLCQAVAEVSGMVHSPFPSLLQVDGAEHSLSLCRGGRADGAFAKLCMEDCSCLL